MGVLIIEDDAAMREVLAFQVGEIIPAVDVADDGEAGLRAFDAARHAIVVTDLKMPGMDGLTVLRKVLEGKFKPTGRVDLKNIPEATEKAINREPEQRFPDVLAFVRALQPNFPVIPAEAKPRKVNWRLIFIVIGTLLAISLLLLLAFASIPQ